MLLNIQNGSDREKSMSPSGKNKRGRHEPPLKKYIESEDSMNLIRKEKVMKFRGFYEYKVRKDGWVSKATYPTLTPKRQLKKELKEMGYELVPFSYKKIK